MAEILVLRIEFNENNPGGVFVAGDIIDVYVETEDVVTPAFITADGLTPYLNGVELSSSGAPFVNYSSTLYTVTTYNISFCDGLHLVTGFGFYFAWPYCIYYSNNNHYSCQINPPTCDLVAVGIPNVVDASDADVADGSITVTATSTNPIQYNLGSDFSYGSGQDSNTFSELLPGNYVIFIKDSAGCSAYVNAVVGVNNVYSDVVTMEYTDQKGWGTKFTIKKRAYSGDVIELCGSGDPIVVSLRGEGSQNKFEQLLSIQLVATFVPEIDGQLSELYTNDPNLYRGEFAKNFGSGYELLWIGKVLPQRYIQSYLPPPHYVEVLCTDSLADLSNYYLVQGDGKSYYGTISLIKLIAFCLKKTGLSLPIRVACNLYADTMDTTDSDDPLDQAYCDFEAIYLRDSQPNLEYVLRNILKVFGASLIQWNGRWNIVRVEEKIGSYDYRDFDADGDYTSNGSYNPVKDISYPNTSGDSIFVNANQSIEIKPGYGKIRANYRLGLKPNILNNGDFRLNSTYTGGGIYSVTLNREDWILVNAGYVLTEGFERIDESNIAWIISSGNDSINSTSSGEAYVKSKTYNVKMGTNNSLNLRIRYKVNKSSVTFAGSVYTIESRYIKLRVVVKYGDIYLQSDGSWTGVYNELVFYTTNYNEYQTIEIEANQPSVPVAWSAGTYNAGQIVSYSGSHWICLTDQNNTTPSEGINWTETSITPASPGMDLFVQVFHAHVFHTQFQSLTSLRAFKTFLGSEEAIPTGYRTELRDVFSFPSYIYYYELEETTSAESGYDIVRPDDYNSSVNPRQWVLQQRVSIFVVSGTDVFSLFLDSVVCKFLTDGKDPYDTITRTRDAESGNNELLEEELIFGSDSSLIVTETSFSVGGTSFSIGQGLSATAPSLSLVTTNALSSQLIYSGWLRSASGEGYEYWSRDGVAESDKLHGIFLKSYALQYKDSWRLLRCDLRNDNSFINFIDVLKESNIIYLPIALSFHDKRSIYNCELLELTDITGNTGSTGSPDAPFTSGFTTGFGSGFN